MASVSLKPHWRIRVNARICRPIPDDPDAGSVAAMFGLQEGFSETLYDDFEMELFPGKIVAVVGPSGAGKSVLLREIASQATGVIQLATSSLAGTDRPAVGVLRGGSISERLELLSRCGLAEAAALVAPANRLSGGQLYRLALAKALHQARRRRAPALVLADEFAATLDMTTASLLCRQIHGLITGSQVALVAATARDELFAMLRPDIIVVKPIAAPARQTACGRRSRRLDWRPRIARGTIKDYDELSSFHYLAGRPAAHKRVYVIRSPKGSEESGGPSVAAVLVVSPPLANVRGRNLATSGRYAGPDRKTAMSLLNAEVECISRVIVHPTFRGCGLAVRLVRFAVAAAETALIEALAAMGAVHPFFEKAGMTAYPVGTDRHVARFISAAEAVGLRRKDLPAVEPVRRLLKHGRRKEARFLREEADLCLRRRFSPVQLSRLNDPVAELCRRTARRYVYYLAQGGRQR